MMVVEKPSKLVAGLFCLASVGFQRPKRDPRRSKIAFVRSSFRSPPEPPFPLPWMSVEYRRDQ
jgi:hypothetical protein